ncbi:MAG: UvrD-helicase domain-containing protein, partial [Pseudomonadota bacterium]
MELKDLLTSLNEQQRKAVQTVDGPLLILAGAGTGKTRTLVYRLAYITAGAGIPPTKLLAITFTAKAAEEMRARVSSLCLSGVDLSSIWIGTMHALCHEILHSYGSMINLCNDFEIISPPDRMAIIKSLAKDFFNATPSGSIKKYGLQITHEKNSVQAYEQLSPFCRAYQERLASKGLLDFDDLILKTLELFRKIPGCSEKLKDRFTHISVDEYQDINFTQYCLIRSLCSSPPNLCVVGDADQAIYAFRGGRVENFLSFQNDFPSAALLHLEENYRSTETIISAARQVIEKNTKRIAARLLSTRPGGAAIEIRETPDDQQEALFVAREIERMLGGTRFETLSH